MASGDLTTGTVGNTSTESGIKTNIDALNLAAATDFLFVLPIGKSNRTTIFKVEREA